MSKQNRRNGHDIVALKEYSDTRLEDFRELTSTRFEAMDTATKLAAEALSIRLEHANEFRSALRDQQERLVTKDELTTTMSRMNNLHEMYMKRLGNLEIVTARTEGRMIAGGVGVAIFSIVITIALHFIH